MAQRDLERARIPADDFALAQFGHGAGFIACGLWRRSDSGGGLAGMVAIVCVGRCLRLRQSGARCTGQH
ncbi:hypothetical protein D3C71_1972640 [compost metagenome]